MLSELQKSSNGVNVGPYNISCVAFADDVSLISLTVTGLQNLIDICEKYADNWRFSFGAAKSKCIILGKLPFFSIPKWKLKKETLENVDCVEILGTYFNNDRNAKDHMQKRITKARNSVYGLAPAGFGYKGGLMTDVKSHLWKTVCVPSLTYNCEIFDTKEGVLSKLEQFQGSSIKQALGLNKFSHNSNLLEAMDIPSIKDTLLIKTCALYQRLFLNLSPLRDINMFFLNEYYTKNKLYNGTLINKIVSMGCCPLKCAFSKMKVRCKNSCDTHNNTPNGVVDSLKCLIFSSNFINPSSAEFLLTSLLTKVF